MNWAKLIVVSAAIAALVAGIGCSTGVDQEPLPTPAWSPANVAVMTFRSVPPDPGTPGTACSPLTGAAYACGIPDKETGVAERNLTESLLDILAQDAPFIVIPPMQMDPVFSRLEREDMGMPLAKAIAAAGKKVGADAVLVGHVYRWRQRVGGELAAEKPASVAFDLAMVRVSTGAVIWKNSFDRTQQSLSENLFNIGQFAQTGLRWVTVQELSRVGLQHLMRRFPWAKRPAAPAQKAN